MHKANNNLTKNCEFNVKKTKKRQNFTEVIQKKEKQMKRNMK